MGIDLAAWVSESRWVSSLKRAVQHASRCGLSDLGYTGAELSRIVTHLHDSRREVFDWVSAMLPALNRPIELPQPGELLPPLIGVSIRAVVRSPEFAAAGERIGLVLPCDGLLIAAGGGYLDGQPVMHGAMALSAGAHELLFVVEGGVFAVVVAEGCEARTGQIR